MGLFLRVRLTSFFVGAATASSLGMYLLYKDYKIAQESISQQMKGFRESLEERISALEKSRKLESSKQVEELISALEKSRELEASKQVEATE